MYTAFTCRNYNKIELLSSSKSWSTRGIEELIKSCTVKLGDKEQFDKEQIGVKEPLPVTNLPFTS
jgi:hypothetical protein